MQRMEDISEELQFSRNHMDCQENAKKIKYEPYSETCNGGQPDINQFTEAIKCEQNRFDTLCYLEETSDYNVCNDLPVYNRKFGVVPVKIETPDDCVKNEPCVSDTCESYMSDFHLPNECSVYVKGHIDNKTVDGESNRGMSNTKNTSWEIKRSSDTPLALIDRIKRSSDTPMAVIDSSNYHTDEMALDSNKSVGTYLSRNTQDRETGMVRIKIEPGTCIESQSLNTELYSHDLNKPHSCGKHTEEGQIPVELRRYTTEHDSFTFESCSNRPILDENLESNKALKHDSHIKYEYNVFHSGHNIKEEVSDRSTEYLDQSSDFHDHINGVGEAGSSSHQHAWGTEIEQVVDQHIKEEESDPITKCIDQSDKFRDHINGVGEAGSSSHQNAWGTEIELVVDQHIKEEESDPITKCLDQSDKFRDHINGVGEAGVSSDSQQHEFGTENEQVVDQHVKEEERDPIMKCLDQSGEFHDHGNGIGEANSSASEKHGRGTENELIVDEPTETFNCVYVCLLPKNSLISTNTTRQYTEERNRSRVKYVISVLHTLGA